MSGTAGWRRLAPRERPHRTLLVVALCSCAIATALLLLAAFGGSERVSLAAPAAPAGDGDTVTIVAVGDTVMGTRANGLPPRGGASFFSGVSDRLAGDVVLLNLEGTLGDGGQSKCPPTSDEDEAEQTCFAFQTPSAFSRVLARAGFTVANLANNHAYDYGADGLRQTIEALDGVGVAHTGRPGQIAYRTVRGVTVAIVGFSTYAWSASMNDPAGVRELLRRAARRADVVVATFHAGAEGDEYRHVPEGVETYLGENRGNVREFATIAVDAGADLVIGHGPHVLRAIEARDGRLVAYSLGNFAGYRVFNLSGAKSVGAILRVTLRRDGTLVEARLVSTRLDPDGVPRLDRSGRARRHVRDLSREDLGPSAVAVSPSGELLLP